MDLALIGSLIALALVDSTSIGTLIVPVWMLLAPGRPPVARVLRYLMVLAGFYAAVGAGLLALALVGFELGSEVLRSPAALWVQLFVGAGLLVLSFRFDSSKQRERGRPSRVTAWRGKLLEGDDSGSVVTVAVGAGVAEMVTMVPYLAAIALLVRADLPVPVSGGLLVGYCLIMVLPALLLLGARLVVGNGMDSVLRRVDSVIGRWADSAVGWALGIAGFFIGAGAAHQLFG